MHDWLIRLYPARWRERYGDELEQLVHDLQPYQPALILAVNLARGALAVHVAYVQDRLAMHPVDRRAVKRAALIAGIVWLGLSAEIVLINVVFASKSDNDAIPVLVSYLGIFAALFLVGLLAARTGASHVGQVLAGLIAGMTIGALTVATFAIVDNVWLDVVAQQQAKIDGFARSGAASMRTYINTGLIGIAVFLTAALGTSGAALSLVGGLVGREPPSPVTATPTDRTKGP